MLNNLSTKEVKYIKRFGAFLLAAYLAIFLGSFHDDIIYKKIFNSL